MSNRRLNCSCTFSRFPWPPRGGETFRMRQASSRVMPAVAELAAVAEVPPLAAAYFCEAEACL
ncbi:hypothetical protein Tdes44962_MAKER01034 [Teratosphaeria destructans]|uniref:Uncharacterized protein n=1 Tax=Teratosphaeria destructans TaxID=418781 RepID=A0A9W7SIA9_9PEZI|nr:hypothetical protein Tdes44962_MAKER01034 [Teratosphaeria destructans]